MKAFGAIGAALLGVAGIAFPLNADEAVSEHMLCRSVRAIFDAPEPDLMRIRAIVGIVVQEFKALDQITVAQGRSFIYLRLSDEGKQTTVAAVTARCDDHPNDTLKQSTLAVYRGIEAVHRALGVDR